MSHSPGEAMDPHERRERSRGLLATLGPETGDEDRQAARISLMELHHGLVQLVARRFIDRGEPLEDLMQVGSVGLLKAIDGFDLKREVEFSTYAVPMIVGELRRYFRDNQSAIRIPRRLGQIRNEAGAATSTLVQRLGRSPTPRELADATGHAVEDILDALESATTLAPLSLDTPAFLSIEEQGGPLAGLLGVDDADLHAVDVRESVKPLLATLAPREKRILILRFFKNKTQTQIAEEVGVSQMQVSRILNKTLDKLRAQLEGSATMDPPG